MDNIYSKDLMLSNLYLEPTDPVPTPTPVPKPTTKNSSIDPKYLLICIITICSVIIISKKH
jgi:hypothetical protein